MGRDGENAREKIRERVREILTAKVLPKTTKLVRSENRLKDDLGFDDLDKFALCKKCQEAFGVHLNEEAWFLNQTVGDIEDFIVEAKYLRK